MGRILAAVLTAVAMLAGAGCSPEISGAPAVTSSTPAPLVTGAPVIEPGTPSRSLNVRWLPSSSPGVVRYDLYVGTAPGEYDAVVRINAAAAAHSASGAMSSRVTLQSDVDLYLALRAWDGQRSSVLSNEVMVPAVAAAASSSASVASSMPASAPGPTVGGGGSASTMSKSGSSAVAPADDGEPAAASEPDAETAPPVLASLDLDGVAERLGSTSAGPLGASGALTLSTWLRPLVDAAPRRVIFEWRPSPDAGGGERLELVLAGGDTLVLVIEDAAGSPIYRADYALAPAHDVWQHLALVFDPAVELDPRVYLDLEPAAILNAEPADTGMAMPLGDGFVSLGGRAAESGAGWLGRLGHTAIYDVALTEAELAEIHARGHELDLRGGLGGAAAPLPLHYWRLGETDPRLGAPADALGFDAGAADFPLDLDDASGGVGTDDVVPDAPTALPGLDAGA